MLGLVKSTDEGETWQSISGLGKADYHEIELAGDRILALRNEDPGMIQISSDGGRRGTPARRRRWPTPIDIAINPGNADQWAVSTDQGTFISANGGKSWRQWDTTFGPRIAWAEPDALYLAGKDGKVKKSPDAGKTWEDVGTIGSGPQGADRQPQGRALRVDRRRRDPPLDRRWGDLGEGRHLRLTRRYSMTSGRPWSSGWRSGPCRRCP